MNLSDLQKAVGATPDGKWGPETRVLLARGLNDPQKRTSLLPFRISEHFTLGELLNSDTARKRGLANNPTAGQLMRLEYLCRTILEPVRAKFGPVRVTSGFRIFTPDSQHGKGEAADFEVTGVPNITVARWIRDTLPFDQLILEAWSKSDPNAGWVHCSATERQARKSVLRTPTGGPPYSVGLPV